jgi:hypothetical protein
MKQRLLNRCKNCGHTWFPKGFDFSKKCPSCEGADVDAAGFLYLALLAVIAIGAGIFWATDRPHKATHAAATPTSTPSHMRPRVAKASSQIPLGPITITNEAEGRREALRLYPELGVPNSPLNREFVIRYNSYQRLQPDVFQNPAWPVILVKESAAAIGGERKVQ